MKTRPDNYRVTKTGQLQKLTTHPRGTSAWLKNLGVILTRSWTEPAAIGTLSNSRNRRGAA